MVKASSSPDQRKYGALTEGSMAMLGALLPVAQTQMTSIIQQGAN